MHDLNFSDLSACTFWLEPGQSLALYTYRSYTTRAWTNATISVYPATTGAEQWIRLDNVTFRATPGTVISGTECVEPAGAIAAGAGPPASAGGADGLASTDRVPAAGAVVPPRRLRRRRGPRLRRAAVARARSRDSR
jgi:hypothetical protein